MNTYTVSYVRNQREYRVDLTPLHAIPPNVPATKAELYACFGFVSTHLGTLHLPSNVTSGDILAGLQSLLSTVAADAGIDVANRVAAELTHLVFATLIHQPEEPELSAMALVAEIPDPEQEGGSFMVWAEPFRLVDINVHYIHVGLLQLDPYGTANLQHSMVIDPVDTPDEALIEFAMLLYGAGDREQFEGLKDNVVVKQIAEKLGELINYFIGKA